MDKNAGSIDAVAQQMSVYLMTDVVLVTFSGGDFRVPADYRIADYHELF